tara:strand:- start:1902 stop:2549 length:648 start_codon:yes stop_codon:yes gene_type:complete
MIPKLIHQVFWKFTDKELDEIEAFKQHQAITKKFCNEYGYDYRLWSLSDCEELLAEFYPEYIQLWGDFRHDIQRADFIRYLILHKYGGFYLDLDVSPLRDLKDLLNNECIFTTWSSDKHNKPYNAMMASIPNNSLFIKICYECMLRTYEKQSMKIYDSWKGRLVFQTTGHFMLNKVVPKQFIKKLMAVENKSKNISDISDTAYFQDVNISSWYNL